MVDSRDDGRVGDARRLLYVCQVFPWVTQTFTVREVVLLRELGVDVRVVSFRRPPEELMDATARGLLPATRFVPPLASAAFLLPVVRWLLRHPILLVCQLARGLHAPGLVERPSSRPRGLLAAARGAWIAAAFPDVSHFHAEFADEAATAAMAAAALAGRSFSFKSHASFNPRQLARKARRAAFVVTESAFDRSYFFADVEDERVLVNRSGVVADETPGDRPGGDRLRIVSVGTLQEKKGQRVLLDALRLLHERGVPFECLIVGSGPLEGELRARVERDRLGDVVQIDAYRPHADVLRLYSEYDVCALPCVVADNGDRDGIPNVLIEAAAAGCVPVSTPVSGIPELIVDGVSGALVPERDAVALADALERLAGSPRTRAALAEGARQIVRERFDLRRNVAELAERFRRALAERDL